MLSTYTTGLLQKTKNSASDSDGDKTVQSELSCGSCVTEDDGMALPNYLVHLPINNDAIVDIDVEEELNERGNGGDLYDDGENAREFDDTMRGVELKRSRVLLGYYGIDQADGGDMESMLLHVGETMNHYEVNTHKAPYYWVDLDTNTSKGDPTFDKVDNPCGQSSFY